MSLNMEIRQNLISDYMESSYIMGQEIHFDFTSSPCCCGCEHTELEGSITRKLDEDIKNYNTRGRKAALRAGCGAR